LAFKTACAHRFSSLSIGEVNVVLTKKRNLKNEKICFTAAFAADGCLAFRQTE
jgi:hypothetical protein